VRGPGVGWACCPARPCSLPETQGEASAPSLAPPVPHPSLQVWEQLTLPASPCSPDCALPCPGVPSMHRTMDRPGSWRRLAGVLGSAGERRARSSSHPLSPPFPALVWPRHAEGVVREVKGNRPFSNVLKELHAELKEFPNSLSWEIVFLHEKPVFRAGGVAGAVSPAKLPERSWGLQNDRGGSSWQVPGNHCGPALLSPERWRGLFKDTQQLPARRPGTQISLPALFPFCFLPVSTWCTNVIDTGKENKRRILYDPRTLTQHVVFPPLRPVFGDGPIQPCLLGAVDVDFQLLLGHLYLLPPHSCPSARAPQAVPSPEGPVTSVRHGRLDSSTTSADSNWPDSSSHSSQKGDKTRHALNCVSPPPETSR